MKLISILGFTFLVSACSLNLGAEKLNIDAKTAKKAGKPAAVEVQASRNDIHLVKRYFA